MSFFSRLGQWLGKIVKPLSDVFETEPTPEFKESRDEDLDDREYETGQRRESDEITLESWLRDRLPQEHGSLWDRFVDRLPDDPIDPTTARTFFKGWVDPRLSTPARVEARQDFYGWLGEHGIDASELPWERWRVWQGYSEK